MLTTIVHTLLCRATGLRVLTTSRVPLGVDGERLVPLGPLPADQAVALLMDRIRAVRPDWSPDAEQARDVRHVVSVLDGIPLALELAAARAGVLGIRELARLLHDRFAVLGSVPSGSLNPHPTLEAAIAWSFDLLPDAERSLVLRLWPHEGGFPLEVATAALPPGAGGSTVELLSSLVSRSVVVADTSSLPSRYRLLGSVRAYCRKLAEVSDPASR